MQRWGTSLVGAAVFGAAVIAGACGNDASGEASVAEGKAVFTKAGCGACHALSDAGATATVGANLDELKPNALKVEVFVTNGSPPTMPSFRDKLTEDEIKAVAAYVQEATGAEPAEED